MHDERACHGCAATLFFFFFSCGLRVPVYCTGLAPAIVSHRDGLMGYPRLISSGTRSAATHKMRATPTSPLETKTQPWPRSRDLTPATTNALVLSRQPGGLAGTSPAAVPCVPSPCLCLRGRPNQACPLPSPNNPPTRVVLRSFLLGERPSCWGPESLLPTFPTRKNETQTRKEEADSAGH